MDGSLYLANSDQNPFLSPESSPKAEKGTADEAATPVKRRGRPKTTTAGRLATKSPSTISLRKAPVATLKFFLLFCLEKAIQLVRWTVANPIPFAGVAAIAGLAVFINIGLDGGPFHQKYVQPVQQAIWWYGRWFVLGVLSSLGVGTGAHTFLLFLGPFIARVTTAAYVCRSTAFAVLGTKGILCPTEPYERIPITMQSVFAKVALEAVAWGAGTAIGEIPPYLVARASSGTGRASLEPSWSESLQVAMYRIIRGLGFWGILVCASIPNPLFDLAGLMCGYFLVPFWTFLSATLIGKTFVKATLQSLFVIFLFSKDRLEHLIQATQRTAPVLGAYLHSWLMDQRNLFQQRPAALSTASKDVFGNIWHGFVVMMMVYFGISIVQSVAVMQAAKLKRA